MGGAYIFIESSWLSKSLSKYFESDEAYSDFQEYLAKFPDKGSVIPGAAPLRKVRWGDVRRGKGARGGIRVVYLHVPAVRVIVLLDVFDKDTTSDLSKEDLKELATLASKLSEELKNRFLKENQ